MKTYSKWLMLVSLLGILGCVGCAYSTNNRQPTTRHVQINADCSVTPDMPDSNKDEQAAIDDTVIWDPPSSSTHKYSANFDSSPFSAPTVATGPPGAQVQQTLGCNKLTVGWSWFNQKYCRFTYEVYQENNKPCKDPGVHVVPSNGGFHG